MLLITLLCIWLLHLILAAALWSPNATVNSTWSTQDGVLLYQTASYAPGIGCGFAQLRSCKRCVGDHVYFFAVYILGYDGAAVGGSGTGADARLAQIIWSANRNVPVSTNSTLQLGQDGNLVLRDADGAVAWESNTAGLGVVGIELQPSANLVLLDSNKKVVWESFSSPTDTLVMGQPLKVGSKLVSTISDSDMSDGHFYLEVEHDRVSLKASPGQEYANWCAYKGVSFIQLDNGTLNCYNSSIVMSSITGAEVYTANQFLRILPDGNFKFFVSLGNPVDLTAYGLMTSFENIPSPCGSYPGACGLYGICTPSQQCSCIQPHFSFIDQDDPPQGCLLDAPAVCSNQSHANEFLELQGMDYGPAEYRLSTDSSGSLPFPLDECKASCLNNCSCKALVFYPDKRKCFQFTELYTLWNASLISRSSSNPVTFIKTASRPSYPTPDPPLSTRKPSISMNVQRRKSSSVSITIITVISFGILLLLAMIAFHRRKILMKHCTQDQSQISLPSIPNLPKLFKYRELCLITNNFQRKLGQGGFGTVFEGILPDGTKVAVKSLESARQGLKQFEAEVMTIGSIHHKNLVKLLGFGMEKSQYYLIYEFVPNLSLDKWLFKEGAHTLDWEKRFNIALDIARGLHYLHEGCQECVLHLDIKPQNILLDSSFQAKICDFGLARLIDKGKSYIDTTMRGTPGYMAPEWLHARVTEKTDVYSFGIVLLEIVSGRKTAPIPTGLSSQNMLRTKDFEQEDTLVKHVDVRCDVGTLDMEQVKRITHIGLWSIQQDYSQRPSMREVVKMLEDSSLDVPHAPVLKVAE